MQKFLLYTLLALFPISFIVISDLELREKVVQNEKFRSKVDIELIGRLHALERYKKQHEKIPNYKYLQEISVKVDNGAGCGTGVLFTRDILDKPGLQKGFIWTAAHVVDNLENEDGSYREAIIRMEWRAKGKFIQEICYRAKIIALGDQYNGYDLALLEITKDCGAFLSAEFAGPEILPVGTGLIHVGCCHAMEDSVSHGIISQTDRDLWQDGRMYDQTSCPAYPGSSGGGVYTLDGKCVGLVTNGLPGLNFFVPVRRMRAWAKKEGIEWALDRNVPVPLTRDPTRFEEKTWPSRESALDAISSA